MERSVFLEDERIKEKVFCKCYEIRTLFPVLFRLLPSDTGQRSLAAIYMYITFPPFQLHRSTFFCHSFTFWLAWVTQAKAIFAPGIFVALVYHCRSHLFFRRKLPFRDSDFWNLRIHVAWHNIERMQGGGGGGEGEFDSHKIMEIRISAKKITKYWTLWLWKTFSALGSFAQLK